MSTFSHNDLSRFLPSIMPPSSVATSALDVLFRASRAGLMGYSSSTLSPDEVDGKRPSSISPVNNNNHTNSNNNNKGLSPLFFNQSQSPIQFSNSHHHHPHHHGRKLSISPKRKSSRSPSPSSPDNSPITPTPPTHLGFTPPYGLQNGGYPFYPGLYPNPYLAAYPFLQPPAQQQHSGGGGGGGHVMGGIADVGHHHPVHHHADFSGLFLSSSASDLPKKSPVFVVMKDTGGGVRRSPSPVVSVV